VLAASEDIDSAHVEPLGCRNGGYPPPVFC
jgi:hypothetical protein